MISFTSSRRKIALFFSILSSIFILTITAITIYLVSAKIEDRAKDVLTKSLQVIVKDYTGDTLESAKIDLQISNTESSYFEENQSLPNIKEQSEDQKKVFKSKSEEEKFSKENLSKNSKLKINDINQNLNMADNANITIEESEEFQPENYQVYSRIILENGDILVSSDLFDEYYIDHNEQGFRTWYAGDICIYSLSQKINSGAKNGNTVQVAQYCSFPKTSQADLFKKIGILTIALMLITYFAGLGAAKFFLKPLKESVRKTKEFTQNVYHELLTPITVAMSTVDVAEKTKKYHEGIISVKDDLKNIRSTLLFLSSRSIQEQKNLLMEKINLSEVLNQIIEKFFTNNFKFNLSHVDKTITKRANKKGLELIFKNLISNAVKYSKPHTSCNILVQKDRFIIENQIENPNNIHTEKFFNRNYRGENGNGKSGKGLGLSIVKELVEAHDWKISAEKKENVVWIIINF